MPLIADRWLNVRPGADPRKGHVSVHGFSYMDSSAYEEALHAPAAQVGNETRIAADVAQTSVIEVWVERLNPAAGEDVGWERVSTLSSQTELSGAAQVPTASAAPSFVVAPQIVRANELKATRRFKELASVRRRRVRGVPRR